MVITPQDKAEWYHHPVTQAFLSNLLDSRQHTMETWAQQCYTSDTTEKTAQVNASALGGVSVLDQVIELIVDYKPIEGARV